MNNRQHGIGDRLVNANGTVRPPGRGRVRPHTGQVAPTALRRPMAVTADRPQDRRSSEQCRNGLRPQGTTTQAATVTVALVSLRRAASPPANWPHTFHAAFDTPLIADW